MDTTLASRGLLFTRAYCQQPSCNPSRASLLTGRRPDTTQVWDLRTHFRAALPDVVTLPQHFKNNGYFAQGIGKIFHNYNDTQDPDSWSVPHTFERVSHFGDYALPKNRRGRPTVAERAAAEDEAYVDGQVASQAVDALRKIKGKPFFLAVGFLKPHSPYNAPERYWALYDDKEIPPAKVSSASSRRSPLRAV